MLLVSFIVASSLCQCGPAADIRRTGTRSAQATGPSQPAWLGRADYPTSRRIVRMRPAASGTATQRAIENEIWGTWPAQSLCSTHVQGLDVSIQLDTSVDAAPSAAKAAGSAKTAAMAAAEFCSNTASATPAKTSTSV